MKDNAESIVWVLVAVVILYLVWITVSPVISPLILAVTIAYIIYPLHERMRKRIGNRISAVLLTSILALVSFAFVIGFALWMNEVKKYLVSYLEDFTSWITGFNSSMMPFLRHLSEAITKRLEAYIVGYTYSIPKLILEIVVMLFVFYGVVLNLPSIKREVREIIPSSTPLGLKLLKSIEETLNDVIRGWLLFGTLKGMSLAFGLWALAKFPVAGSIAIGLMGVMFELLPVLSSWMLWIPIVVYLLKLSYLMNAFSFAFYGFFFVSPIPDWYIKPKIVMRRRTVNPLVSLLGVLGGLMAFGLVGVILGPVSISLLQTLIVEWKKRL